MATDFKLSVGLDVLASAQHIRDYDIPDLTQKLENHPLKLTATANFNITNLRSALSKTVGEGGGLEAMASVKFINIQDSLTRAATELKQVPVVKVKAAIDESSINDVMNKIAKELKLDFTPQEGKSSNSTKKLAKDINEAAKETKKLHDEFSKVGSTAETEIGRMTSNLNKFSTKQSDATQKLALLSEQFRTVGHLLDKNVWDENETKQVQDFLATFRQVSAEVKVAKQDAGDAFFNEAQLSKVKTSLNQVRELVAQYPKILSDPRFKTWYESFNAIDFKKLDLGKTSITKLITEMADFISQAKQAGLATKTLGQRFEMIAKNATIGRAVTMLLMQVKRLARDAYENVKNLDSAMVELKKVTTETASTYSKFFENAKQQAAEVGATLSDVIKSTADFARLGYDIAEAADLAKAAQIYYNVGDGFNSITEASESVISTMKAFGVETRDVMTIVDAFNTTGNNFAISTSGVGEAMKRSASALAAAGNDMYESIALITAANTVVQDPESVGTALKTKVCLDVQKCAS